MAVSQALRHMIIFLPGEQSFEVIVFPTYLLIEWLE